MNEQPKIKLIIEEPFEVTGIAIKPTMLVKVKDFDEAKFNDKVYSIAIYPTQILVVGEPPEYEDGDENTWHNCDTMGCGWEHVLMRINVEKVVDVITDTPARLQDGFRRYQ